MIEQSQLLQNRYLVLKKLGKGGFGQTFEVDDRGIIKVLKVLTLSRFSQEESKQKAVDLFQREAAVLSRLNHPGIPKVEPDGYFVIPQEIDESLHCLVMEKIDGVTLKQWRTENRNYILTQEQAISWLKQLVEILEQLHRQDLIHRDIKPSNIMLRPDGQLVLIDFGAVREITATYLQRQRDNITGTVIISTGYTPPEQMEGHAVPQSDFFALGRTFVYLLTGKSPIDLDRNPRTGKLQWRERSTPISREFGDLIEYMMATFHGQRPQKPQMILNCIEDIVSPKPPLPPPPPIPQIQHELNQNKPRSILGIIFSFLQSKNPVIPWEKVKLCRTLTGHKDIVESIAIAPNGEIIVSGSYDGTIKLWSLRTGELQNTLKGHNNRITCIAISPDGQTIASGSYDQTIKLWSLSTGKFLQTLEDRPDRVRDIAFSPNGQVLLSIGEWEIKLWAVRTGKLLRILAGNSQAARLVAFSPDSNTCAIGSLNGTLEMWHPNIGRQLRTFGNRICGIGAIAFSPDGQILASGSGNTIDFWQPQTGKLINSFSIDSDSISSLVFSPDGKILASASGTIVEMWNVETNKRLSKLSGHAKPVYSLAFNPEGDILVSGAGDQTLKIWQWV
jgi:WD40 repeat protein/predicted Ser/Thr protein kinase